MGLANSVSASCELNNLPWLASRHLEHHSNGFLAVRSYLRKPFPAGVCRQIPALKKCNQLQGANLAVLKG